MLCRERRPWREQAEQMPLEMQQAEGDFKGALMKAEAVAEVRRQEKMHEQEEHRCAAGRWSISRIAGEEKFAQAFNDPQASAEHHDASDDHQRGDGAGGSSQQLRWEDGRLFAEGPFPTAMYREGLALMHVQALSGIEVLEPLKKSAERRL